MGAGRAGAGGPDPRRAGMRVWDGDICYICYIWPAGPFRMVMMAGHVSAYLLRGDRMVLATHHLT